MKVLTTKAEYTMEKTEDGFAFSVREHNDFCMVRVDHLTEKGAILFFNTIKDFDVRACQLTATAEDMAIDSVSEILRELL